MIKVHVVGEILLRGIGIGQKVVNGKVCVAYSIDDFKNKIKPGNILVVASVVGKNSIYAAKAAAIITEEGGLCSNAAIIGINSGIPVIVGVYGAVEELVDGTIVTVDGARGLIYRDEINTSKNVTL